MAYLRIGGRVFAPSLWHTATAAVAIAALLALGFWQLHRADEKLALRAAMEARGALRPVDLNAVAPAAGGDIAWRRVTGRGGWRAHQFLLDNQIVDGRAGYRVLTPFAIDGCACAILVDRGWIAAGATRTAVPPLGTVPAARTLAGTAAPPPQPAFGAAADVEALASGLERVQRVDLPALAARVGMPLLPVVVRLDPALPEGFLRRWPPMGIDAERHVAYAVQWFLLAALLLALYVGLNLRRT